MKTIREALDAGYDWLIVNELSPRGQAHVYRQLLSNYRDDQKIDEVARSARGSLLDTQVLGTGLQHGDEVLTISGHLSH